MSGNFFQILIFILYLIVLGGIIYYFSHLKKEFSSRINLWIYALAVPTCFFSGWTFVGLPPIFLKSDLIFMSYQVGIVLFSLLFPFILERMYAVIERYNVTDIVSFVIQRYNKNSVLKYLVVGLVILITVPYLTLNIKSLDVLLNPKPTPLNTVIILFSLVLIFFFVYFIRGWRNTTAIALQGVVMIISCLILGVFVLFFVFQGPQDLFSTIESSPFYEKLTLKSHDNHFSWWNVNMLLSFIAFLFLPRQFSVISQGINLDKKKKIFLMSVVLIVFFLICQAFYSTILGGGFLAETIYMSDITMDYPVFKEEFATFFNQVQNSPFFYLIFLLGGFSFIFSSMNQEILAFTEIMKKHLKWKFVISVFGFLCVSFGLTQILKDFSLDRLGVLCFLGVSQLAVPILGGMFWRGANSLGAITGLAAGIFFWIWFGWMNFLSDPNNFISGRALFSQELFQIDFINLIGAEDYLWRCFFYATLANTIFFVLFSLIRQPVGSIPAIYLGKQEGLEGQKDFETILELFQYDLEMVELFSILYNNQNMHFTLQEISEYVKTKDAQEKLDYFYAKGLIQQIRRKNRVFYALNPEVLSDLKFELFFRNFFTFRLVLEKVTESAQKSKKAAEQKLNHMQALYHIYLEIISIQERKEFFTRLSKILSPHFTDIIRIEVHKDEDCRVLFKKAGQIKKNSLQFKIQLEKETLVFYFQEQIQLKNFFGIQNFFVLEPVIKVSYRLVCYIEKLKQYAVKLKNLDSIRSHFVSNVSHELRTPMAPLKGYLNVLKGNHSLQNQPEIQEILKIMSQSYKRLEDLIENLINFKENSIENINLQNIWLYELLFGAIMDMKETIDSKEIKVIIQEEQFKNARIEGDKQKLKAVFIQVLDNAVKFNRFQGKIVFDCKEYRQYYIVKIKDNGIGIGPEILKHIFEPFYQADLKDTKNYQGAGLGLSLAKKNMQMHGGSIKIKSLSGKGTIVKLKLLKKISEFEELEID